MDSASRAFGEVTVFNRGQYQMIVLEWSRWKGDLMRRFLELKQSWRQKVSLLRRAQTASAVAAPQRIGIVTSPTGAVIHGEATVNTGRRFPNLHIRLAPVRCRASAPRRRSPQPCAFSIAHAVGQRMAGGSPDCRRGGSPAEDLWSV